MTKAMGRGLDIIWQLVHGGRPQTAAEVAAAIDLNRASAYRLLESLIADGWISGEGHPKRYTASLRVAELGATLLAGNRVRQVVLPYMVELSQMVQNRVLLNFYEDGSVVITDVVDPLGERTLPALSGHRVLAASTASGKILLAFQPDEEVERVCRRGLPSFTELTKTTPEEIAAEIRLSRERGYGTVDRELQPEFSSIALPLFDHTNVAVAAFGLSIAGSLTDEVVARLLEPARQMAHRASVALGQRPSRLPLVS